MRVPCLSSRSERFLIRCTRGFQLAIFNVLKWNVNCWTCKMFSEAVVTEIFLDRGQSIPKASQFMSCSGPITHLYNIKCPRNVGSSLTLRAGRSAFTVDPNMPHPPSVAHCCNRRADSNIRPITGHFIQSLHGALTVSDHGRFSHCLSHQSPECGLRL